MRTNLPSSPSVWTIVERQTHMRQQQRCSLSWLLRLARNNDRNSMTLKRSTYMCRARRGYCECLKLCTANQREKCGRRAGTQQGQTEWHHPRVSHNNDTRRVVPEHKGSKKRTRVLTKDGACWSASINLTHRCVFLETLNQRFQVLLDLAGVEVLYRGLGREEKRRGGAGRTERSARIICCPHN